MLPNTCNQCHEWTIESWRPIAPAFAKPEPSKWSNAQLTLAWLGHSTVLINLFGVTILTDPVLFPRVGIRLPGFTIGPKRLTAPALHFHDLPHIDAILLSHAHFDHLDLRTLRCFDETTRVITARATSDLLKQSHFSKITELSWGESKIVSAATGEMVIAAFPVRHWGARTQHGDGRARRAAERSWPEQRRHASRGDATYVGRTRLSSTSFRATQSGVEESRDFTI